MTASFSGTEQHSVPDKNCLFALWRNCRVHGAREQKQCNASARIYYGGGHTGLKDKMLRSGITNA